MTTTRNLTKELADLTIELTKYDPESILKPFSCIDDLLEKYDVIFTCEFPKYVYRWYNTFAHEERMLENTHNEAKERLKSIQDKFKAVKSADDIDKFRLFLSNNLTHAQENERLAPIIAEFKLKFESSYKEFLSKPATIEEENKQMKKSRKEPADYNPDLVLDPRTCLYDLFKQYNVSHFEDLPENVCKWYKTFLPKIQSIGEAYYAAQGRLKKAQDELIALKSKSDTYTKTHEFRVFLSKQRPTVLQENERLAPIIAKFKQEFESSYKEFLSKPITPPAADVVSVSHTNQSQLEQLAMKMQKLVTILVVFEDMLRQIAPIQKPAQSTTNSPLLFKPATTNSTISPIKIEKLPDSAPPSPKASKD